MGYAMTSKCAVHFCHACGRNIGHVTGKPGDREGAIETLELIDRYQLTVRFGHGIMPGQPWAAYQPGCTDMQGTGATPAEAVFDVVNLIIRNGGERKP